MTWICCLKVSNQGIQLNNNCYFDSSLLSTSTFTIVWQLGSITLITFLCPYFLQSEEDYKAKSETFEVIYLPGCEVHCDLCVASDRFNIHILVPVTKRNLPLSAAFEEFVNPVGERTNKEDIGVGGRLRRRASLLSLTSLSNFGQHVSSAGDSGLCGSSAAALGFIMEIILRFTDPESYTDWLAYIRLATAILPYTFSSEVDPLSGEDVVSSPMQDSILTKSTYDAERKAIAGFIRYISPSTSKNDEVDGEESEIASLLDARLSDFLPMRLGVRRPANINATPHKHTDQVDGTLPHGHPNQSRNNTLSSSNNARPPMNTAVTGSHGHVSHLF